VRIRRPQVRASATFGEFLHLSQRAEPRQAGDHPGRLGAATVWPPARGSFTMIGSCGHLGAGLTVSRLVRKHTVGVVHLVGVERAYVVAGPPLRLHLSVVTVLHMGIARPHHRPRYRLRLSASPDADQPVCCPAPFYALTTKRKGAMSWGTSACSMEGPSRVQPRRSIRTVLWSVETGRNLRSNRSARWLS